MGEDQRNINIKTFADTKREVRQDDPNDNKMFVLNACPYIRDFSSCKLNYT